MYIVCIKEQKQAILLLLMINQHATAAFSGDNAAVVVDEDFRMVTESNISFAKNPAKM